LIPIDAAATGGIYLDKPRLCFFGGAGLIGSYADYDKLRHAACFARQRTAIMQPETAGKLLCPICYRKALI
jgi:hypothetical protein